MFVSSEEYNIALEMLEPVQEKTYSDFRLFSPLRKYPSWFYMEATSIASALNRKYSDLEVAEADTSNADRLKKTLRNGYPLWLRTKQCKSAKDAAKVMERMGYNYPSQDDDSEISLIKKHDDHRVVAIHVTKDEKSKDSYTYIVIDYQTDNMLL